MTHVWFTSPARKLRIATSIALETLRTEAFDFPLRPERAALPMTYGTDLAVSLAAYRRRPPAVLAGGGVARLAKTIRRDAGGNVVRFLTGLCRHIHESYDVTPRKPALPEPAARTLERGHGAPRDLAWLFVEACRAVGLAARFASGFHEVDFSGSGQLHAWAEVYLPGGGWRGFDPCAGVPVTDAHVVLAAAAAPRAAAAVMGSYRGSAQSDLKTEYSVTVARSAASDPEVIERTV